VQRKKCAMTSASSPAREARALPRCASPRVMIAANTGLFQWLITLGFQVGQKFVETIREYLCRRAAKIRNYGHDHGEQQELHACVAIGLATSLRDINANQTRCAFGCRHLADPTVARIEVLLTPPIHLQFRSALFPPDELIILVPFQ
jgi:hypothetical protein